MNNSVFDWIDISEKERMKRKENMIIFRSLNQSKANLKYIKIEDIVDPNKINILIDTGFAWRFVYTSLTFVNNWKDYNDVQLYAIIGLKSRNFEMIHRINSFYKTYINRDIIKIIPTPKGSVNGDIPRSYKEIYDKMDHYLVFSVVFAWVGKHKKIFDYFKSKGKRTMYIGFDDLIPNNQQSFIKYADVAITVNCKKDQTPYDNINLLNPNSYYHPHTVDCDMFVPKDKVWDFQLLHSFEPYRIIKRNRKGQLNEVKLDEKETLHLIKKVLVSTNFHRDYRIIKTIFKLPGNNIRGGHNWESFPIKPGTNWSVLDDSMSGIYNSSDWTQTMDLFGKSKYTVHLYRKVHENASYFYTERPILSFASGCIIFADELGNNDFLSQHGIKWNENVFKITHKTKIHEVNSMIEDIESNYQSIISSTRRIGLWWDYRNWLKRFREIIFDSKSGDNFECPPIKN